MVTEEHFLLAVNGTLMRNLALTDNLLRVGGEFCFTARTDKCYRMWSVRDAYPAMLRVDPSDSAAARIAVEVWSVPASGVAAVLQSEPPGLSIGKVLLDDGRTVLGVIGEPETVKGMREITMYGGWRDYIASDAFGARQEKA